MKYAVAHLSLELKGQFDPRDVNLPISRYFLEVREKSIQEQALKILNFNDGQERMNLQRKPEIQGENAIFFLEAKKMQCFQNEVITSLNATRGLVVRVIKTVTDFSNMVVTGDSSEILFDYMTIQNGVNQDVSGKLKKKLMSTPCRHLAMQGREEVKQQNRYDRT